METQWKILLIDDDPGILKVMKITMEEAGYQVFTALDGESGIEVCKTEQPPIVVTDIRMPGMDGLELLRRVKKVAPDTEVIVATAFGESENAVRALQLGASDFIVKPISHSAMAIALRRAQRRYAQRRELQEYTALIEERWMVTAEKLASTFQFQKLLIESSLDGIAACDREGKIIVFNRSMEDMIGVRRDDVMHAMAFDQLFPPEEVEKFHAMLASEEFGGREKLLPYETWLAAVDGARIPVQLSAVVMYQEKEARGIVGFFRDRRERRKIVADQARILHQDKMISLGKLAASVVHEINNPLAGILNYVRLMSKILGRGGALSGDPLAKFQGYLTLTESELSRCSKIVSGLLAFSRTSKLEFGPVNVNELIGKCILLSQHKLTLQNIKVETDLKDSVPPITGDGNQLQQCIINLIFNAIDAMPQGGALTLASGFDPKKKVVSIMVRDTGSGIAKEDLPYIFDPFYTTKTEGKGLGLGLSTTYGIIDRHKGVIQVESEPSRGTLFRIELPAGADSKV